MRRSALITKLPIKPSVLLLAREGHLFPYAVFPATLRHMLHSQPPTKNRLTDPFLCIVVDANAGQRCKPTRRPTRNAPHARRAWCQQRSNDADGDVVIEPYDGYGRNASDAPAWRYEPYDGYGWYDAKYHVLGGPVPLTC